jgi:hypothetical protein
VKKKLFSIGSLELALLHYSNVDLLVLLPNILKLLRSRPNQRPNYPKVLFPGIFLPVVLTLELLLLLLRLLLFWTNRKRHDANVHAVEWFSFEGLVGRGHCPWHGNDSSPGIS